jgi:carbon-monoxide dehydrogenase small subunit
VDQVRLVVNGEERVHPIEPWVLLVDFLRDYPGITSVKVGCDTSQCGTCTVLMSGVAVKSCTMFAIQADGSNIETAEGLIRDGSAEDLELAFREGHATQCGYCSGGMIVAAEALLRAEPEPEDPDIRRGLDGNLCRCTDYRAFIDAIVRVAAARRAARPNRQ